MIKAIVCLLQL